MFARLVCSILLLLCIFTYARMLVLISRWNHTLMKKVNCKFALFFFYFFIFFIFFLFFLFFLFLFLFLFFPAKKYPTKNPHPFDSIPRPFLQKPQILMKLLSHHYIDQLLNQGVLIQPRSFRVLQTF